MYKKKRRIPTESLFSERIKKHQRDKGMSPDWTLKERSWDTLYDGELPSLYEAYLDSTDEYDFITTHLEGMGQWEKLLKCKWFFEGDKTEPSHRGIEAWRLDMISRDRSIAKKTLLEKAKAGNASAATSLANLIRADHAPTKGRPREEDLIKAAQAKVEDEEAFADDISRLNVVKIRPASN